MTAAVLWWEGLSTEVKLELRSCRTAIEVERVQAVERLHELIPAPGRDVVSALALLLGAIQTDDPETRFICRLGKTATRPAFSEIHFSRLKASRTLDELISRLKRAILLLRRSVQVHSLAECVILWSQAYTTPSDEAENLRVALNARWDEDYRMGAVLQCDSDRVGGARSSPHHRQLESTAGG